MSTLGRFVAAILACLAPALAAAQGGAPLVFDMGDPNEAARWRITAHDDSQGPAGVRDGGLFVATGTDANVFLERSVTLDAARYNRAILDVTISPDKTMAGFAGTAMFFSPGGEVIPESRILRNVAANTRTQVVFLMEQSVFWEGMIGTIRFDPVWGPGTAVVHGITIDWVPPPSPTPSWRFSQRDDVLNWLVGEFRDDTGQFHGVTPQVGPEGMSFSSRGPNPVLQLFDAGVNADLVRTVEMVVRVPQPAETAARFFWCPPDDMSAVPERSVAVPVSASNDWQRLRFDVAGHPAWRGPVGFVLVNPSLLPGTVEVKSIEFQGVGGLGQRGQQDALVNWRTHEEVGGDLEAGNYKPLLVLITREGNSFSKRMELELASDAAFREGARYFHAVRLEYDDPATTRVFPNIYRVPVLATMTYDFGRGTWIINEMITGPDVASDSIRIMRAALR